jgi:NhaP-type Na+/H+ or K+/H+ antiporter
LFNTSNKAAILLAEYAFNVLLIHFNQFFLVVFVLLYNSFVLLPPLLWESATNVHWHTFTHAFKASVLLAGPAVLILIGSIAILAHYVFPYNWDWSTSLLFGSILATTDPVAVVAMLRELGASRNLATLIEGESLLNDGSAFVIFLILLDVVIGKKAETVPVALKLMRFCLGGPAFGLMFGIALILWLNFVYSDAEIEITSTLAISYLCFWIGEASAHTSAIVALVV